MVLELNSFENKSTQKCVFTASEEEYILIDTTKEGWFLRGAKIGKKQSYKS